MPDAPNPQPVVFVTVNERPYRFTPGAGLDLEVVTEVRGSVGRLANHYARRCGAVQADDLFQEGMLGAMTAARRFDPGVGLDFGAFAYTHIRGAILGSLQDRIVRAPGGGPWVPMVQLDLPTGGPGEGAGVGELADATDTAGQVESGILAGEILARIRALPERASVLLLRHLQEEEPLAEIARELGITRQYASMLYRRYLEVLRGELAAWAPAASCSSSPASTIGCIGAPA